MQVWPVNHTINFTTSSRSQMQQVYTAASYRFLKTAGLLFLVWLRIWQPLQYSRTCLEKTPNWHTKMWSVKTGGLWWQVQLHWNVGPSAKSVWSFKTGGLSWQWNLKIGFTVVSQAGTETTWYWLKLAYPCQKKIPGQYFWFAQPIWVTCISLIERCSISILTCYLAVLLAAPQIHHNTEAPAATTDYLCPSGITGTGISCAVLITTLTE